MKDIFSINDIVASETNYFFESPWALLLNVYVYNVANVSATLWSSSLSNKVWFIVTYFYLLDVLV
jgi:hypothetical protein